MRPALRRGIAAAAVVGLVGSGYAAYAANADDPSYRTATATVGDVEETLGLSGTVEPAGRADLSFATSGTIADIEVEAGDTVRAGQRLGSLDATTLRKQVQQARAALAAARAQLENDRTAQSASVAATVADTATAHTVAYRTVTHRTVAAETDDPLAALQQAVIDAQSVVSDSLAAAADALAAQQAACTAETVAEQDCADALVAVQAAQQQVSDDQTALQTAIDALAGALEAAGQEQPEQPEEPEEPEQPQQPQQPEQPEQPQQPTQPQQPDAEQPETQESTTPSVSAATLAKDQATIDQAEADLVSARQELRTATVTAPFGGEVVAVDAAEGDSVASGTAVFVLVSRGTTTVDVTATSTQVQRLKAGQAARVTPTGAGKALVGTVTQVSSIPDDSGSYPVTITLDRRNLDIATGLTASARVVTGTASDVVTVPASAVSDGVVQVVEDGAATRVPVTTGVTGQTSVEVTEGLEKGDVVVLADLDRALPSGDSETGAGPGGGPLGSGGGGFGNPGGMGFSRP